MKAEACVVILVYLLIFLAFLGVYLILSDDSPYITYLDNADNENEKEKKKEEEEKKHKTRSTKQEDAQKEEEAHKRRRKHKRKKRERKRRRFKLDIFAKKFENLGVR